ncbi:MAG: hydrogenase expression/formation protein HypE [Desulfobacterales bacterium]|nr:hydrogenase expression/formation protein HypE [Desulfobacterales bacterium]
MANAKILLDHGSGGKMSHRLISDMMLPLFDNPVLSQMDDGAKLELGGKRLAFSTDTFTVDPIFFPGGSIGDLAINGTVNDVAMCGATPQYLSVGLLIEEGFAVADLEKILVGMSQAAAAAGVTVVTGDTKVVPKGAADRIFINTSGIGVIPEDVVVGSRHARVGDVIILSGSIAEHGVVIMTQREGMTFASDLKSDTAPLHLLVKRMLGVSRDIHVLRDPTRGGVGTALNEIADRSHVGVVIHEDKIPVKNEVLGICELMGFDPLYIANEGKLLAFVGPAHAEKILGAMQADPNGLDARIIGEVVSDNPGMVCLKTRIGGIRIVDMLTGEQLPRIC